MKRRAPDPTPASIVYLLKQIEVSIRYRLEELLADSGVTAAQFTALTTIRNRPESTGADLARRFHVRPQSANELITSLERAGLIERHPSPTHRRRLRMTLTASGSQFLKEYDKKIAQLDEQLLSHIPRESHQRFREELMGIRRALDRAPESQDRASRS